VISRCSASTRADIWLAYADDPATATGYSGWVFVRSGETVELGDPFNPQATIVVAGNRGSSIGSKTVLKTAVNDRVMTIVLDVHDAGQSGDLGTCYRNVAAEGDTDRVLLCWKTCSNAP
jgi:hypothetical protein